MQPPSTKPNPTTTANPLIDISVPLFCFPSRRPASAGDSEALRFRLTYFCACAPWIPASASKADVKLWPECRTSHLCPCEAPPNHTITEQLAGEVLREGLP
jgi:hypothetical protein